MQAVAKSQKIKKSTSTKVFYVICYTFVALMALVCLLPFIMVVSGSFSSEQAIRFQGYGILPREFTTAAYALIFKSPMTVVRAYGVSIFITLAGTAVGLLLTTMTAYVISRKDFKYRNALSFFFYFTTLFNGGMVCSYIFYIQYLHLKRQLPCPDLTGCVQCLLPVDHENLRIRNSDRTDRICED